MLHNSYTVFFFFFKQKTAYEIRPCDWSSDVCSSDLELGERRELTWIPTPVWSQRNGSLHDALLTRLETSQRRLRRTLPGVARLHRRRSGARTCGVTLVASASRVQDRDQGFGRVGRRSVGRADLSIREGLEREGAARLRKRHRHSRLALLASRRCQSCRTLETAAGSRRRHQAVA